MSRVASPQPRKPKSRRYIGRQRIVDLSERTVGYELLYRANRTHTTPVKSHPNPSQDTLDCSVLMGLDTLCGTRTGFFNCSREVLTGEDIRLLPTQRVVLEILEDVSPDREVLEACAALKRLGFQLALDDFVPTPQNTKFLDLVDILKVDFQGAGAAKAAAICHKYGKRFQMVAEKVETQEEHDFARRCGYDMFQGFLFGKPEVLSTRAVSETHLRAMRAAASVVSSPHEAYLVGEAR